MYGKLFIEIIFAYCSKYVNFVKFKHNTVERVCFLVVDLTSSHLSHCSQTLSDLATICAVICYDNGPRVNSELLGAFRALCIPNMPTLKTGFSALTNKSNVSLSLPGWRCFNDHLCFTKLNCLLEFCVYWYWQKGFIEFEVLEIWRAIWIVYSRDIPQPSSLWRDFMPL